MLQRNKLCNILHTKTHKWVRNPLKEFYMIQIEKYVKQYEELAEQVKQVNEFWFNSVLSSVKEFFKVK